MSINRSLSWSAALRDLKADRHTRSDIREERVRSAPGFPMAGWRGKSAKRYVCNVFGIDTPTEFASDVVLIAVIRDAQGNAVPFHAVAGMSAAENARWAAAAREHGATEVHVHRLAETATARAAILADLGFSLETEAA